MNPDSPIYYDPRFGNDGSFTRDTAPVRINQRCEYCADARGEDQYSLYDIDGQQYKFCYDCWSILGGCDYCERKCYRDIAVEVVIQKEMARYWLHPNCAGKWLAENDLN